MCADCIEATAEAVETMTAAEAKAAERVDKKETKGSRDAPLQVPLVLGDRERRGFGSPEGAQ